jgi:formylmethanofuran dehydrogenase subunit D
MLTSRLILITGRSTKQGTGISTGKEQEEYQIATTVLQLSPDDMARFGLSEGDTVKLKTDHGEVTVKCRCENLPEGLAFMAFGPATSQLVGGETHATGMPDSKGFEVELVRVSD